MKQNVWMAISGACGFGFFLVANFTHLFQNSSLIAACVQIPINAFVFVIWGQAFRSSSGPKKLLAFCGVIVPVFMAGITFYRVILPWISKI